MKIFVINPGSTSTKIAVYEGETKVWMKNIRHTVAELTAFAHINDQYDFRKNCIAKALAEADISIDFDVVVGRGGLLKPLPEGVYPVNNCMRHDLWHAPMEHACNLGVLLADEWAQMAGCQAYTANPVVVDEMQDKARITGLPQIHRLSIFHALNSKAVARRYAAMIGQRYEELDLIVAHLGGGISVAAHFHGAVIDVNDALNGDGPFAPDRAGSLPALQLAELCFSGHYTFDDIRQMLSKEGGVVAHLGLNDMREVEERALNGDKACRRIIEAMMYNVAKQIGAMHVVLYGKTQAIVLTGGLAYSDYCLDFLREQISFIAPVCVIPGEDEMDALVFNVLGALQGTIPFREYTGKSLRNN